MGIRNDPRQEFPRVPCCSVRISCSAAASSLFSLPGIARNYLRIKGKIKPPEGGPADFPAGRELGPPVAAGQPSNLRCSVACVCIERKRRVSGVGAQFV